MPRHNEDDRELKLDSGVTIDRSSYNMTPSELQTSRQQERERGSLRFGERELDRERERRNELHREREALKERGRELERDREVARQREREHQERERQRQKEREGVSVVVVRLKPFDTNLPPSPSPICLMQLEHQIAAETLLSILPRSNRSDRSVGGSASPEHGQGTPAGKTAIDHRETEINGLRKRKADGEADVENHATKRPSHNAESRSLASGISPLFGHSDTLSAREEERRRELEREGDRMHERARLMEGRGLAPSSRYAVTAKPSPGPSPSVQPSNKPPPQETNGSNIRPTSGLGSYGRPTARYSSLFESASPSNTLRESPLSSTQPTTSLARTAASPWAASNHPYSFNQTAVSRKELLDHKEQLLEGKKWLEATLLRTEKLLNTVNDRLTESNPATLSTRNPGIIPAADVPRSSTASSGVTKGAEPGPSPANGSKEHGSRGTTSPWSSQTRSGYSPSGNYLFGLAGYSSSGYRATGAVDAHREAREKEQKELRERERLRDLKDRESLVKSRETEAERSKPSSAANSPSTSAAKPAEPARRAGDLGGYRGFWPLGASSRY